MAVGNRTSTVSGTSRVNGSFTAAGNTQFNSNAVVTGAVGSTGSLGVTGNANFGSNVTTGSTFTVGGSSAIGGTLTASAPVDITGSASFGNTVTTPSTVTVGGSTTLGGSLLGNGTTADFILNGPVEVNGDVAIQTDNLTLGGAVTGQAGDTLTISPVTPAKVVNIGAASPGETLLHTNNVANLQAFGGDLNLGGRVSESNPTAQNFGNVTVLTPLGIGFNSASVLTNNTGATPTGSGTLFIASLGASSHRTWSSWRLVTTPARPWAASRTRIPARPSTLPTATRSQCERLRT